MALYHGRRGLMYISTTGTGNASSLTKLTEWTLDATTDMAETTSFGDSNKTYVQGIPDCSGSFSGFWDNSDEKAWDAADSSDGCKIYLYPSSLSTGIYWYGPAWVDISITVGVGDAVSVSGNWKANGAWGRVWA